MIGIRRVVIVEDDGLLRSLLKEKLESFGFDAHVAHDSASARSLVDIVDPDLVILDIDLGPGPTGLDLAQIFRSKNPSIAIAFLTHLPDPNVIGGAKSVPKNSVYLVKDRINEPTALIDAIDSALRGKVSIEYRDDLGYGHPLSRLSKIQLEVVQLLAQGCSNREIASRRGTSVRAVESLLARVFEVTNTPTDGDVNPRILLVREYLKLNPTIGRQEA